MPKRKCHHRLSWVLAACVGSGGALTALAQPPPVQQPGAFPVIATEDPALTAKPAGQGKEEKKETGRMAPEANGQEGELPPLAAELKVDLAPIDLDSALKLAGISNPQILLARQQVVVAVAQQQLAAAQLLPNLNYGGSYDNHNGNLQQSNGNILKVDRGNLYLGAGANAIAGGSVSIPGLYLAGNPSLGIYGLLISRQVVEARKFASLAMELTMLLRVAETYNELVRTEGLYALTRLTLDDARRVEDLTSAFAKAQVGRQGDADRASTEREQREAEVPVAEGENLIVSARLAELLNLPPCTRLVALENKVVPCPLVPNSMPLPELLAIAILNRPELQEYQAVIRQGLLAVDSAKMLPFSPNVILGLSYGTEAGGSNLVHPPLGTTNAEQGVFTPPGTANFAAGLPRFGVWGSRMDFDAVVFWALDNFGLGNKAQIQEARAQLGTAQFQFLEQLNRVRAEVADAYARVHARYAEIGIAEQAVRAAALTYETDRRAVAGFEGRPIELLESLRLLARSRFTYLNTIADYNRAQLELYVALGKPPPEVLAQAMPPGYVPPGLNKDAGEKK